MKHTIAAIAVIATIAAFVATLFAAPTVRADSTVSVFIPLAMNGKQSSDPTPTPVDAATKRAEVIAAVNAERAKVGCVAVVEDATLTAAAQAWSDYLVAHNIVEHSAYVMADWYGAHGYTTTDWVSENIAGGQETGAEAVADWMDDAGHRAVVLQSCDVNPNGSFQVGVGWQFHTWTLAIGELHN